MSPWARTWTRAVVVPAGRRASAVWLGCAFVAAVIFGPTGMQAGDLTGLALHVPGVGAVLALIWILMFAPTARLLVRAEAASYLRALPAPRALPIAITAAALVALQLPWIALWIAGEGARGIAMIAATTLAVLALASWRPRSVRAGWPMWRRGGQALRAIHLRALRRRAGDAIVRGAGLALLAGGAGGLFVRNNGLAGEAAAPLGASVIAVVSVPAHIGVVLVIAGAHRETAWLARTLGISPATRAMALVFALAIVHLAAAAIALGAACTVIDPAPATIGWLAILLVAIAIGSALAAARGVLGAEASPSLAGRTVIVSVVAAAGAVLCLGLFGVAGGAAFVASAALAFALRAQEPA